MFSKRRHDDFSQGILLSNLQDHFCGILLTFKRTVLRSTNARRTGGKLLSALSAIAAPSARTLQKLCTFLVRVPALGAAMVESAVSRLTRVR